MTSKTVNRLTFAASLAVFLAAIYVLYRNLQHVQFGEVLADLEAMPVSRLAIALFLTAGGYLILSGYDYLALRYVDRKLKFRHYALTAFIGFAFSHNIGFALVTGGSVRYRIYSGLGLTPGEVAGVVVFCAITFGLGITTVGGLMLALDPMDVASIISVPESAVRMTGAASLAIGLAYLAASAIWRRPILLGRFRFRLPSFRSGIAQIALASIDLALAGGVVYVLLPPDSDITYRTFLGIYVMAAAASVMSHVPGGLGVFEAVIVMMLPGIPKAASMSAMVAYRFIYFLLPLAIAMASMAIYEVRRGERALGWIHDSPAKPKGPDET